MQRGERRIRQEDCGDKGCEEQTRRSFEQGIFCVRDIRNISAVTVRDIWVTYWEKRLHDVVTSVVPDQPSHPHSLIRAYAAHYSVAK